MSSNSNISKFYKLDAPISQYSNRFKTDIYIYPFSFLNIEGVEDVHALVSDVLESIADAILGKSDSSETDLVGFQVDHPALDKPILMPYKRYKDFKTHQLIDLIEMVAQSKKELDFDSTMKVKAVIVHLPSGSGYKRQRTAVDINLHKKQHTKGLISIPNTDKLCLARAIVTGIAYINFKNPDYKWDTILKGDKKRHTFQKTKALELMQKAGLANHTGACSFEEVKKLEQTIADYQIKIYDAYKQLIYEGTPAKHTINIWNHNEHYTLIAIMNVFMGTSYYCEACSKGYNTTEHHRCHVSCPCCHRPGQCARDSKSKYCNDCCRYFNNENCFSNHKSIRLGSRQKQQKLNGTVCDRYKRCLLCGKLVTPQQIHQCGYFKCHICKEYVPEKDHLCYIQPYSKENEPEFKFIFFDFETTQEMHHKNDSNILEHKINLAVAQIVCPKCVNNPELGSCPGTCGNGERVFYDRDSFCNWLFSPENSGATAIAHDGQFIGFDGQFILQYLQAHGIVPKVIPKGNELMSIYVKEAKVRIIDSINFLNMPLAALPKTFGFQEQKKGYFPHLFNIKKNVNYVGPIPDAFFYNAANMKPKAYNEFFLWYKQQKDIVFDFQKEFLQYCRSDVDILRKCCLKFRKDFIQENDLDPLLEAITIAGACNKVYRSTFLKPQSIGIIPNGGYRRKDKCSVIAIKWLMWLSETNNLSIRHARNFGEARIEVQTGRQKFKVDGLCGNTVYEFYGCYWHGCPKCLTEREQLCAHSQLTAHEAHEKTIERKALLESEGYTVIEKWQCELDAELTSNKIMQEFFDSTNIVEPLDPREGFFGGRTNATRLHYKIEPGETIKYIDVVSLYPYVNKYGHYPLGHPEIITENFATIDLNRPYEGMIKCTIIPPRGLYHPVLPHRANGKLTFPLCRTCVHSQQKQVCQHSDAERALIGAWCTDEIYKALEKGYKILKVHEVWHYDTALQYNHESGTEGLFEGYINRFLKMKQEADGFPARVQTEADKNNYIQQYKQNEGVELDIQNINRNPGRRALAKLCLNSFWGKFGQRNNQTQMSYITEPKEYFKLLSDPSKVIKSINFISDTMVMVTHCAKDEFIEDTGYTNVMIAAYTTCHARLQLYSYLEQLGERVLYFDTDSVIYVSRPGESEPEIGSYLGCMSDELKDYPAGSYISEFVSGGAKNYAYKIKGADNKTIDCPCKVRGFTLSYTANTKINFKSIRQKVIDFVKKNKVSETVLSFPKIQRDKERNVLTATATKKYGIVYDKRVLSNDFNTLPYGY